MTQPEPEARERMSAIDWLRDQSSAGCMSEEEAHAAAMGLVEHRERQEAIGELDALDPLVRAIAQAAYEAGHTEVREAVEGLLPPAAVTLDREALAERLRLHTPRRHQFVARRPGRRPLGPPLDRLDDERKRVAGELVRRARQFVELDVEGLGWTRLDPHAPGYGELALRLADAAGVLAVAAASIEERQPNEAPSDVVDVEHLVSALGFALRGEAGCEEPEDRTRRRGAAFTAHAQDLGLWSDRA